MSKNSPSIVFQGELGANSHIACREMFPHMTPLPAQTFEDAFSAVSSGQAKFAMIPIENSLAGRVADIHHLLPTSGLFIVDEHFLRIRHQLLVVPGVDLSQITHVMSHGHALGQCREIIRKLGLTPIVAADTAGSARLIAESKDTHIAAIASELAAQTYGLEALKTNIEDETHNTTRFIVLAGEPDDAEADGGAIITSFIFRVRNVPAALYKALGGFATNGVNMTKLESYIIGGSFAAAQFYADIEGHPTHPNVRLALEELGFFSSELKILGAYSASGLRTQIEAESSGQRLVSGPRV
jgi:prephenate dehydratase